MKIAHKVLGVGLKSMCAYYVEHGNTQDPVFSLTEKEFLDYRLWTAKSTFQHVNRKEDQGM